MRQTLPLHEMPAGAVALASTQRTVIGITPTDDVERLQSRPTVPEARAPEARVPETKAPEAWTEDDIRKTMVGQGPRPTLVGRGPKQTIVGLGPDSTMPSEPMPSEPMTLEPMTLEPMTLESEPVGADFEPSAFARDPGLAPPEPLRPPLRRMDTSDWALLGLAATVLVLLFALLL